MKLKYEQALKTVNQLSKIQKRLFAENSECIQNATKNVEVLTKFKQEYESSLQDLSSNTENRIIKKLSRVYFIVSLEDQRKYYLREIIPLKSEIGSNEILKKEFDRAKIYVLSNCVEGLLENLENDYTKIRSSRLFIELESFLSSQEVTDHIKGCLALVFEQFISEFNDELSEQKYSYKSLLEKYISDLNNIFLNPSSYRKELYEYFLNYIRHVFIESIPFKYHNNINVFFGIMDNLYTFFEETRKEFPEIIKQCEKSEKLAFGKLRDFLLDFSDKFELIINIDKHYDFLSIAFKTYDSKALKIWMVDLIDSYVDSTHTKESEVFNKYALVFKLGDVKFMSVEKFFKTYLKKKIETFVKNQVNKMTLFEMLGSFEKPSFKPNEQVKFVAFYKDFFRKFIDHVDKVIVPNVKNCSIKDADFRNYFYQFCIKATQEVYHKELSTFLALDFIGVEKKSCFELFANDLEEQMKEDLYGF